MLSQKPANSKEHNVYLCKHKNTQCKHFAYIVYLCTYAIMLSKADFLKHLLFLFFNSQYSKNNKNHSKEKTNS